MDSVESGDRLNPFLVEPTRACAGGLFFQPNWFIIVYKVMDQFNKIWNEYYPKLTVFLRTSFQISDPDDLVQEIMMKVFKNLNRYNNQYSFNTWLYTIARNHTIDSIRKQSTIRKTEEAAISQAKILPFSSETTPEQIAIKKELQRAVADYIKELPELQRQIAFLRFHEDLKYSEIGKITGIPEGTAKYHIHNIKKDFEQFYGEHYED
ncbi:MAG: sigma-70 family RNA polymerase sigma factor [Spirochaetales bacterium]|nr:sigma-70 family RNA polymerase sigma factor [Spirochaetales bacterium]